MPEHALPQKLFQISINIKMAAQNQFIPKRKPGNSAKGSATR
jgi:hypothetical protein